MPRLRSDADTQKTVHVMIRLTPAIAAKMTRAAKRAGRNRSEWLREVIERELTSVNGAV